MDNLLIAIKFFSIYTIISIALGLILARIMRFGLHYKPPEIPPLPSGSINRDGLTQ